MKKHNLYKHSDDYPCQCGVCGKRFKDSSAVRLHERIHSTARPYSCQRCGKSFKTRENLWGHRHRGPCERFDLGSSTAVAVALECLSPSPTSAVGHRRLDEATTTAYLYDDRKQVRHITVTINTTKQPQYLPKISDVSATTVAIFELITVR